MARPLRNEVAGALYVTSRGNERRPIFRNDHDRRTFLSFLGETGARFGWSVSAYVLMTNHFHLVIQTPEPNLSRGRRVTEVHSMLMTDACLKLNVEKFMARTTCAKCGGGSFELRETAISGAKYRLYFVQCSSCGGAIAVQDSTRWRDASQTKRGYQTNSSGVEHLRRSADLIVPSAVAIRYTLAVAAKHVTGFTLGRATRPLVERRRTSASGKERMELVLVARANRGGPEDLTGVIPLGVRDLAPMVLTETFEDEAFDVWPEDLRNAWEALGEIFVLLRTNTDRQAETTDHRDAPPHRCTAPPQRPR